MTETPILDAALDYVGRGLEVFPLRGKFPAISTEDGGHGLHDATSDIDQLTEWFVDMKFTNIGIAIPPNIIALDIDKQHDGHLVFATWAAEHGKDWISEAPRQRTGNLGIHAWFWCDLPYPKYKLEAYHGIELGRVGRYVVGAPSVHPDTGRTYEWEVPLPKHYLELKDRPRLPDWLLEIYKDEPVELEVDDGFRRAYNHESGNDDLDDAIHAYTSWSRLLGTAGWTLVKGDGNSDGSVWRHPTASSKQSATIKYGLLFNYSANTVFPETTYNHPAGVTLFNAFKLLEHDGDGKRAYRVLKENGYIKPPGPSHSLLDDLVERLQKVVVEELTALPVASDEGDSGVSSESSEEPVGDALGIRTDWPSFWLADGDDEVRWLCEPIVAAKRAHALYAGAKTGKSLLMLELAAALATGREFLDKPKGDPVPVLYCDYEMTPEDLRERLEQFGYGPADDLDSLSYYFLGAGRTLDTIEGGAALIETAANRGAKLVVVDTVSRAVAGGEQDADTFRAFYRCAGIGLKRLGIAWVRIDHAGKDATKGQRGSSAKNDDVDVVWRLDRIGEDQSFDLKCEHQRTGWIDRKVPLKLVENERTGRMAWERRGTRSYPDRTKETAEKLDELGAPLDISKTEAGKLLRSVGWVGRNDLILEAFRWRREVHEGGISDVVAGLEKTGTGQ